MIFHAVFYSTLIINICSILVEIDNLALAIHILEITSCFKAQFQGVNSNFDDKFEQFATFSESVIFEKITKNLLIQLSYDNKISDREQLEKYTI